MRNFTIIFIGLVMFSGGAKAEWTHDQKRLLELLNLPPENIAAMRDQVAEKFPTCTDEFEKEYIAGALGKLKQLDNFREGAENPLHIDVSAEANRLESNVDFSVRSEGCSTAKDGVIKVAMEIRKSMNFRPAGEIDSVKMVQSYADYLFIKTAYEMRDEMMTQYITVDQLEMAKKDIKTIEVAFKAKKPNADVEKLWADAAAKTEAQWGGISAMGGSTYSDSLAGVAKITVVKLHEVARAVNNASGEKVVPQKDF